MSNDAARSRGQDLRVIGLVGSVHATSHFFQLVLPPLFPLLKDAFGVGYAELGVLVTLFYGASGLSQTAAGFAVDRFGARPILAGGLLAIGLSLAVVSFAHSWQPVSSSAVSGAAARTRPIGA